MWDNELTLGQQRAILAEVLTVTVQPTTGGGRAPDGSYFNSASVDIALTERARAISCCGESVRASDRGHTRGYEAPTIEMLLRRLAPRKPLQCCTIRRKTGDGCCCRSGCTPR